MAACLLVMRLPMRVFASSLLFATLFLGCSEESSRPDGGGGGRLDAASSDAGVADAGGGGPDSGSADSGVAPLVSCPAGATLEHHSLAPLATLPSRAQLEFTGLVGSATIENAGTGLVNSGRFDVCRDAQGQASLRAFLFVPNEFSTILYRVDETISAPVEGGIMIDGSFIYELRLPPDDVIVTGLDAALIGDLNPLEIRFMNDTGLWILGHDGFVGIARGMVGRDSITYTALAIVTGALEPGDVFANLRCPLGQTELDASFRLGTANFSVEACTFLGGGFTTGYEIVQLSVTDSNPALSAEEQRAHVFEGKAAVEAVLTYQWNHHNACDSFHLALPHADYAASSAPAAGCGLTVPNAPARDINEDPSVPVKYRIRYHGGAWVDGELAGCSHYLFCSRR